ncbi:MAG: hypothetical protein JXN59_02850 [Anaerolineae bacterium]|nr:hypothetical protein [Anaerolineae bacterium]
MITVEVVGSDGRAAAGVEVMINWDGYTHSRGRTDSAGRVSWDVSSGSGKIYVEGTKVHEGRISGTMCVQR